MNDWQNQTTDYPPYTQPAGPIVDTSLPPGQYPPPSRGPWWILGIVLGGCGCGCLLLVGGGLLLVVGGPAVMFLGSRAIHTQLRAELKDLPFIQQHLGDVESVWPNVEKTDQLEKSGQAKPGTIVCDITGAKAEGELYVEPMVDSQGQAQLVPVQLVLSTGEKIPLLAPLKVELPKNPLVQQSLGDIESILPDTEKTKLAGPDVLVCTIVGTNTENDVKIQGDLYLKQMVDSQGQPRLVPSKIIVPNDKGEEKEISFEAGAANRPFGF